MDEIAVVKDSVKYSSWMQMVKSCRESGLTVKHWCSQNNISSKTYYYRLKKVRTLILSQGGEFPEICPLPITQPVPTSVENITVHLEGISIEIPRGADEYTIANLLRAVKQVW